MFNQPQFDILEPSLSFCGSRSWLSPGLAAGAVEAFGEAAFLFESARLCRQLAVEKMAAEVEQRESGVGHQGGG